MTFNHLDPGTAAGRWRAHPRWPAPQDVDVALTGIARLLVLAAHPDDETLGAGALTATAAASGIPVDVLVLTDGEGSHPHSPTTTPDELASLRREEARAAARALGGELTLLGLPDGGLAERHEEDATREVVRRLGDGRDALIVAPWRRDGHPDHEAAGRAAAAAAVRTGARLLEYPVWFWHWGDPQDAPWDDVLALRVDERAADRKTRAVAAHRSQVAALSSVPGDEVLLGPEMLAHFAGDREIFIREQPTDPVLDDLHEQQHDPWGVTHRWYERRKRDLVLATLPRDRFARGLDLGCSRGELAAALARRCDDLLAVDGSPAAVARAREVVPAMVEVVLLDLPSQWPTGSFDLVVLSEVGYFLSPIALEQLFQRTGECLAEHGVVVLCHWMHPIDGWALDGADVHARALTWPSLPPLMARYRDDDVEILVLAHPVDRPDPHA